MVFTNIIQLFKGYSILWNAVTSPENVLNGNSVKTKLYMTPLPYFIVWASSVTTMEVKAIQFHRIPRLN